MKSLVFAALLHDIFWAIETQAGNLLLQQLRNTDAERHVADFQARISLEPQAFDEDDPKSAYGDKGYEMSDNVAILRLSGPMTKQATSMSSGTSTVLMRRALRTAGNDPDVKGILLICDSPGGSVSGTADLGDDVAAVSKKKLTVAYAEDMCCSAAYWTASQAAGGLYANATSIVGSIGTVMVAYDTSRMYANAGVEALVFSTGKLKGAGADGSQITEEQRASFQKTVDDLNDHFLGAVSRGRNMERSKVEKLADGGVLIGKDAQKAGLVDGISSLDDVLKSMKSRLAKQKAPASSEQHDFALDGPLPVGASLEQSLTLVHDAVSEVRDRVAQVQSLRAEEGRRLSATRLGQVRSLHGSLGDLLRICEQIPVIADDCTPSPAATEPAAETLTPIAEATRTALEAALESIGEFSQAG